MCSRTGEGIYVGMTEIATIWCAHNGRVGMPILPYYVELSLRPLSDFGVLQPVLLHAQALKTTPKFYHRTYRCLGKALQNNLHRVVRKDLRELSAGYVS